MSPFVPLSDKRPGVGGGEFDFNDWNQIRDNINAGVMRPIGDSIVGVSGSIQSIVFSSIPTTFAHLFFLIVARGDSASNADVVLRMNNDATGVYDYQVYGVSATAIAGAITNGQTYVSVGWLPGSTAPANSFGIGWGIIPNYINGVNHKKVLFQRGYLISNASGGMNMQSGGGLWRATPAAINRLDFVTGLGFYTIGTRISLFGIGSV